MLDLRMRTSIPQSWFKPRHTEATLSLYLEYLTETTQPCPENPTITIEALLANIRPYSLAYQHTNRSRRLHHFLPEFHNTSSVLQEMARDQKLEAFAGKFSTSL